MYKTGEHPHIGDVIDVQVRNEEKIEDVTVLRHSGNGDEVTVELNGEPAGFSARWCSLTSRDPNRYASGELPQAGDIVDIDGIDPPHRREVIDVTAGVRFEMYPTEKRPDLDVLGPGNIGAVLPSACTLYFRPPTVDAEHPQITISRDAEGFWIGRIVGDHLECLLEDGTWIDAAAPFYHPTEAAARTFAMSHGVSMANLAALSFAANPEDAEMARPDRTRVVPKPGNKTIDLEEAVGKTVKRVESQWRSFLVKFDDDTVLRVEADLDDGDPYLCIGRDLDVDEMVKLGFKTQAEADAAHEAERKRLQAEQRGSRLSTWRHLCREFFGIEQPVAPCPCVPCSVNGQGSCKSLIAGIDEAKASL
jgi:hypothetical protein